jgi:hypothetical protein
MGAVVLGLSQESFLCSGNLHDGEDDPSPDFTSFFDFPDLSFGFDTPQDFTFDPSLQAALTFDITFNTDNNLFGSGVYDWTLSGSPDTLITPPTFNFLGGGGINFSLAPTPVGNVIVNNVAVVFNITPSSETAARETQANNGDQGDKSWLSKAWDSIADPVDPITGAFHIEALDLRIPGPFPLDIGRNYSSQNLSDMNNFGFGWRITTITATSSR